MISPSTTTKSVHHIHLVLKIMWKKDVVSEPRMTREAADEFWKKLGSSLEAKIASGFTEELAILQAEMIQKEMKKNPE